MSGVLYSGQYQFYPFGNNGDTAASAWYQWNALAGVLTVSFASNLPIHTVWIPSLSAAVSAYDSSTGTVPDTPFYTTSGSGAELIPLPPDVTSVTLEASTGTMYVYVSSVAYDPTKVGPTATGVQGIHVVAPILSTGGSVPTISLDVPLAVDFGGTGTASPSLIAGAGIDIEGDFPNQTVSATSGASVTDVTATLPLASSGGNQPNISIETPISQAYGGTGVTNPTGVVAGSGIGVAGTFPNQTVSNTGVASLDGLGGAVETAVTGGLASSISGQVITLDGSALLESATSPGGTIAVTKTGQNIALDTSSKVPITQSGVTTVSMAGSPDSRGFTTVTVGSAYADANSYFVFITLVGYTHTPYGQSTITQYVKRVSGSQFSIELEGDTTVADTITVNWMTMAIQSS